MVAPAASSLSAWKHVSIPTGGSVDGILVHGSLVYAAAYGGVYISEDSCRSWHLSCVGLTDSVATAFAEFGDRIYVGTRSQGVFVSTDNGSSWNPFGMSRASITALAASRQNIFAGTEFGLFRSPPDRPYWVESDSGFSTFNVNSISAFGDTLFVRTGYAANLVSALYRSKEGGLGIWKKKIPPSDIYGYAATDSGFLAASSTGIFNTTDVGGTWSSLISSTYYNYPMFLCLAVRQGRVLAGTGSDGIIAYAPRDTGWALVDTCLRDAWVASIQPMGDLLLAVTHWGVFRSSDDGVHWEPGSGILNGAPKALLSRADTLLAASPGLSLSTDDGETWSLRNNGLVNLDINRLAFSGSTLLAGTGDGVFRSIDIGQNWNRPESGLAVGFIHSMGGFGRNALAAMDPSTLWRSTDEGMTWQPTGIVGVWESGFGAFRGRMYVTSTGNGRSLIVSSADSGAHWTTVSSPATWIKCFGSTTRRLFIGTFTEGLFSTSDGGASWSQCDQILARNLVSGIISFRDTLFVATTGVFQSNDDGASWTDISENLQQVPVTSVAVCGRYLFAVTEKNGLWRRPLNELITSAPARDNASVPGSSSLAQNFPNPFNPTTTIAYEVPSPSRVKLAVYDILGREIAVLVDGDVRAGKGLAKFDGSTRSSGVYIYRIEITPLTVSGRIFRQTHAMTLIK